MIPSAELRVYQPLDTFPPDQQVVWERWLVDSRRYRSRARYRQFETAPGLGFLAQAGEGASVRVVRGRTYLSPDRTRLRTLAGMLATAAGEPFEGAGAFVPRDVERRARREFRRVRRRRGDRIASAMDSPWSVPVHWFLLFEDRERRLVAEPAPGLSYLTKVRSALTRIERAVPILRAAEFAPAASSLIDLHRWLSSFPAGSLVELDYGSLCALVGWERLDDDHGAREMADALEALAHGEVRTSSELVGGIGARWSDVAARPSWN